MGGGGRQDDGGKGGKRPRGQPAADVSGGRRFAFKVLCPEPLVSSVIGPRGTVKDALQKETGCKIVVSNRDDYFPSTRLRVLVIYGESPDAIVPVLEAIVDRIIELGETERQSGGKGGTEPEFLGKEDGEYVFRATVSTKMSGAIIGSKGSVISAIREECNAKVFIDKPVHQGHQICKIIAAEPGFRNALLRVHDCVMAEAGSEDFVDWASVRSFDQLPQDGPPPSARDQDFGDRGGGRDRERSPRRGVRGRDRDRHPQQPMALGDDNLQAIAVAAAELPPEVLERDYVLTCDLPSQKVSALIGVRGEHISHVRRVTGTKVRFEDAQSGTEDVQRTLLIQGPLLATYRAHALMMKQYHQDDMQVDDSKGGKGKGGKGKGGGGGGNQSTVEALQAQLLQLQGQLTNLQGGGGGAGTGGGGREGKPRAGKGSKGKRR